MRTREAQEFENLEGKRVFFSTIKSIFDIFLNVILMAKIEIEDTIFNYQNKTFHIKNSMHI